MATQSTRDYLRGFLVHDKRLSLWTAETDATAAGPRAGEAVPTARGDGTYPELSWRTSGEQDAGRTLTVQVQQGGHVGDLTIGWSEATSTGLRGWDNATHVAAFEPVVWSADAILPDVETAPDGVIYLVAYDAANYDTKVWARNPTTRAWSSATLNNESSDPGHTCTGCLAVDASGAVWCWSWRIDTTSGQANLLCHVRRPGASSWTLVSRAALENPLSMTDYELGQLRAAINADGQVLMLAHLVTASGTPQKDVIWQWAAEHPSAPLREILTDSGSRGYPDVLVKDGAFWCFYLTYNTGSVGEEGAPILRVVGSAFQSLDTAETVSIRTGFVARHAQINATPQYTEGSLAAVVDEAGTVTVYTNRYGALSGATTVAGQVYIFRGTLAAPKGGETNGWELHSTGATRTWFDDAHTGNSTEYPRYYAACAHRGRVFLASNFQATVAATEDYCGGYYLGGWTSAPRPYRYLALGEPDREPLEMVYVPIAAPGSMGWTATGAGTGAYGANGWNITTTLLQALYYTQTSTSTSKAGYLRFVVDVTSGGALGFGYVGALLTVTDGAQDWQVRINFDLSGGAIRFRVLDGVGTTIGSDVNTAQAAPVEVFVALAGVGGNGHLDVYWRVWSTAEDHVWTRSHRSTTLPAGGGTTSTVEWGHRTASAADSIWRYVLWSFESIPARSITEASYPDDVPGAPLGTAPRFLGFGVEAVAMDGPGIKGDAWTVAADAEYALARLDPQSYPSPSETWRATGTGAMNIAWRLNTLDVNAYLDTDLLGIYIAGANTRKIKVYTWNSDATPGNEWIDKGWLDLASGRTSLPYVREGDTITPNPSASFTLTPYLYAGELVGGTVDLGGGKYRRIRWNTDGWWAKAAGKRRVVIWLEDVDDTEAASGTCDLWSPRALWVHNRLGNPLTGVRLAFPSQANADGYHELGQVVIGPVHTFARYLARGGQQSREALVELAELVNGYRGAHVLNTPRRTWTIPFSDLHDERELQGGAGRYSLGTDTSGGLVLANTGDEWSRIDGLLQYLDGAALPCVYVPLIAVSAGTSTDEQTYVAERHSLYGRLMGAVAREHVAGEIETGWTWRGVDALVLEEER